MTNLPRCSYSFVTTEINNFLLGGKRIHFSTIRTDENTVSEHGDSDGPITIAKSGLDFSRPQVGGVFL
jgi:hypothetical protein